MQNNQQRIAINGNGDLPRAINTARALAEQAGFATTQQFMIATAVSELATNIVRYATRGEISITIKNNGAGSGIQVVATDKGPGIDDPQRAMQDHYSTGGGLGLGLPGVKRLVDELTIGSRPGVGTTVTATKWLDHPRHALEPSVAIRPLLTDVECGDTAVVSRFGNKLFMGLVDVLGHGKQAYAVAETCKEFLEEHCQDPLVGLMQDLHKHIKGTRGAVAGLCVVESDTGTLKFVGIGNITVRTLGTQPTRMVSRSGVIGDIMPTPREESLALSDGDLLLMYTDGVKLHFEVEDWPQMRTSSVATMAHDIINLFGKDEDDAGCIALRYQR